MVWNRPKTVVLVAAGFVASALVAGIQGGDPASPPETAGQHLERGERWAGAHNYDHAIAEYNCALDLKLEYAEAFNDHGHA